MTIIEKARLMRSKLDMACTFLTDEQAEEVTILYPMWAVGVDYAVGDRRQYNGLLYKCLQAHTSQADWTPDVAVSLWVRTYVEEWIPWYQPTGAHDAWMRGMRMAYTDGHHYICLVDGTVYPPDVVPTSWEFVE